MCTKLFFTLVILLSGLVLFAQEPSLLQVARPNVILIVSHGHGWGDLGCYGNPSIKTPNLDRLAANGVMLTNAYANVSSGSASQSVILTGLYNHSTGQYGQTDGQSHFSVFPEIRSLPYYLKGAGYKTAVVGAFPLASENNFPFDTVLESSMNARNTYEMAERCKPLFSTKTQKPFFLYFCPSDPNRSNESGEDDVALTNSFGNRSQGYEGILPTYYKPSKIEVPRYLPDLPKCRKELAQYAQAISRMDLGIGRLFEILKNSGLWDNTLIIYLTDCGIAFPGAQTTLYEPGIKLPCIIKPPFDKPMVNKCDAMVSWVDVTPTILDFCQAMPPEYSFHGLSFKDVLNQEHNSGWETIFASHTFHEITMYFPMRMVMNRRYKLIWNMAWQLPFPIPNDQASSATWQEMLKSDNEMLGKRTINAFLKRSEFELYDLINDPDELKNLLTNPEFAGILNDLKARLKSFQVKTNDPWITRWNE